MFTDENQFILSIAIFRSLLYDIINICCRMCSKYLYAKNKFIFAI